MYNSSVRMYTTEILLNGWTYFDEICSLSGSLDSLNSQLNPICSAAVRFTASQFISQATPGNSASTNQINFKFFSK